MSLASAVAVPSPPPSPTLKHARAPTPPLESPAPASKRLKPSDDPRARSRRLFSTLLTTLSAPPTTSDARASARRKSIEAKTAARLRSSEDEEQSAALAAKRREMEAWRARAQPVWLEEGRRLEERDRTATAGFLRTRTLPYVYWLPRRLKEEQKVRIERQVEKVRREEEVNGVTEMTLVVQNGLLSEGEKDQKMEGVATTNGAIPTEVQQTVEEPAQQPSGEPLLFKASEVEHDKGGHDEPQATPVRQEEDNEEMVDNGEDSVIY